MFPTIPVTLCRVSKGELICSKTCTYPAFCRTNKNMCVLCLYLSHFLHGWKKCAFFLSKCSVVVVMSRLESVRCWIQVNDFHISRSWKYVFKNKCLFHAWALQVNWAYESALSYWAYEISKWIEKRWHVEGKFGCDPRWDSTDPPFVVISQFLP